MGPGHSCPSGKKELECPCPQSCPLPSATNCTTCLIGGGRLCMTPCPAIRSRIRVACEAQRWRRKLWDCPHAIASAVDHIDTAAEKMPAVNTLIFDGNGVTGHNIGGPDIVRHSRKLQIRSSHKSRGCRFRGIRNLRNHRLNQTKRNYLWISQIFAGLCRQESRRFKKFALIYEICGLNRCFFRSHHV